MKRIFILFLIQVILYSCQDETKLITNYIKPNTTLSQLNDSTFFVDIRSINHDNDNIYMVDGRLDQIFILDKNYMLTNCVGIRGNGPGELSYLSKILVDNDTLYVYNGGKMNLEVFKQSSHIKSIKLPSSIRTSGSVKLAKSNKYLYVSSVDPVGCTTIASYNIMSGDVKKFGNIQKYNSQKEICMKNLKHLLTYNDLIIAIPNNSYSIEIYDSETNFIREVKYNDISILRDTYNYINSKLIESNSYYVLISDAYIYENYLYLMLLTYNKKTEQMQSNTVLEINLNDDFRASRLLNLGEGWFEAICIFDKMLLSFDSKNANTLIYDID